MKCHWPSACLLSVTVLLSACDERKASPAGPAGSAPEGVKKAQEAVASTVDQAEAWADRLKDNGIFKDGQRMAEETLEQGKAELAKMDIAPLKKQADELMVAMRAGDFAAAEKAAAALDASLESKMLQRTVAVLNAKTEQGNDEAQALIDGYVKLPELGPEERKFFEGLSDKIVNSSTDDRVNFVVFAAIVACEIASKGQGGGKLPEVVMELLFGKEYGILKENYEWKNPIAK